MCSPCVCVCVHEYSYARALKIQQQERKIIGVIFKKDISPSFFFLIGPHIKVVKMIKKKV